jgi:hypothetical protein
MKVMMDDFDVYLFEINLLCRRVNIRKIIIINENIV